MPIEAAAHARARSAFARCLRQPLARGREHGRVPEPPAHPVTEKRKASSSIKFCYIARGEADLYARLGATSEWDTAAGHAILAAAGGSVTTAEGEPLRYGKAAERFANPYFVAWGRGPLF